jgi:hypothetical protein
MQAQSSGAADSEAITTAVVEADDTATFFQANARKAATASTARSMFPSIPRQIGARKHDSKKRSFADMSTTPTSGSDFRAADIPYGTILHPPLASALPINGTGTYVEDAVREIDVDQEQTEVDNLSFAPKPHSAIRSNIAIGLRHQQDWTAPEESSEGVAPLFGNLPLGGGDDLPLDNTVHELSRHLPQRNDAASGGRSLFNASTSEIPDEGITLERPSDEVMLDSEHLKQLKFGNSQNMPIFLIPCYDADSACDKLENDLENSFPCDNVDMRLQSGQDQPHFDEIHGEDGVGNYLSSVNPVAPPNPYP